jgi:hypothetical protein
MWVCGMWLGVCMCACAQQNLRERANTRTCAHTRTHAHTCRLEWRLHRSAWRFLRRLHLLHRGMPSQRRVSECACLPARSRVHERGRARMRARVRAIALRAMRGRLGDRALVVVGGFWEVGGLGLGGTHIYQSNSSICPLFGVRWRLARSQECGYRTMPLRPLVNVRGKMCELLRLRRHSLPVAGVCQTRVLAHMVRGRVHYRRRRVMRKEDHGSVPCFLFAKRLRGTLSREDLGNPFAETLAKRRVPRMICPGKKKHSPKFPAPHHLRYRTRGRLRAADRREALLAMRSQVTSS